MKFKWLTNWRFDKNKPSSFRASAPLLAFVLICSAASPAFSEETQPASPDQGTPTANEQPPTVGEPTDVAPSMGANHKKHTMSLIGRSKYQYGFKQFDYVNTDAPKGGRLRLSAIGTFDNLNAFTIKGNSARGLALIYDQLMVDSLDEGSTSYGQLAEWVSYPEDYSSVTFKLRDSARFHDGKPVTVEDVIFSLTALKEANPFYKAYYKNITRVEKTGDGQVTFYFDVKNNRELPFIAGQLNILPKHFWQATDKDGNKRDLNKTTLEAPLGSGAYKIKEVKPGQRIVYERVKNYWGANLPVNIGQNNFDEISFEYFRDQNISFEAFKSDQFDFVAENSSKNWATGYDIPSVKKGHIIKRGDVHLENPQPMQGFVFNLRHKKFQSRDVREAFNIAFNFEWANKNLFYGQYKRTSSYFQNTELASSGLPKGRELAYLKELKGELPEDVFTTEYKNTAYTGDEDTRKHLRRARKLLQAAGWTVRQEVKEDKDCGFFCKLMITVGLKSQQSIPVLRNQAGEAFEVEFLLVSPLFKRIVLPYMENLSRLGIKATIRLVDSPQYQRRLENFDYDIITYTYAQSDSPGNEQRNFWGSKAAGIKGSRNYIGIKNPAVDKLIDKIIFAKDRDDLVAVTRALDRVLLWNYYLVPQWHVAYERFAHWDRFSHPKVQPSRAIGVMQTWWYDSQRAEKLNTSRNK